MITTFRGPSADSAWQKATSAFRESIGVHTQNSRGGVTKEILHVGLSVEYPRQRWVVSREPALNIAFALAEVIWIMTGRRDLRFLEYWNTQLPDYVGSGADIHGAYGYRLRHHFGIDQLDRAYQALNNNSDSRQVVLQIWDSRVDFPKPDGSAVNEDVPCNTSAMVKIRDGRLEWLQTLRSNDMLLGFPHNIVQFTCVQEILAGWLGVECGSYNQISDSLHVYIQDWEKIERSIPIPSICSSSDDLSLPRQASDRIFTELEHRVEAMIDPETKPGAIEKLGSWDAAPQSYGNIAMVLAAEALRRRGLDRSAARIMSDCTNPVYQQLWSRWFSRVSADN